MYKEPIEWMAKHRWSFNFNIVRYHSLQTLIRVQTYQANSMGYATAIKYIFINSPRVHWTPQLYLKQTKVTFLYYTFKRTLTY